MLLSKKSIIFIFIILFSLNLQAENHFKIGAILPLSGPLEEFGLSIQNSIELAKSENPDSFNKIKFIYEDMQNDMKQAVTSLRKLVKAEKVNLVYVFGVPSCKALAPIAESYKIPLIGQCIDKWSSKDREYVIRFMNYTDEYMRVLSDYLYSKNIKKIGIVLTEQPYLYEMYISLKDNLNKGQSLKIIDNFLTQQNDFRTSIIKTKKENFDALGVFLHPGQISQFYKQARDLKLNIPSFGTNFFENLNEIKASFGSMDGAIFVNNHVSNSFMSVYNRKYNNSSQMTFGALAYEFAKLSSNLFNTKNSYTLSAKEILSKIKTDYPKNYTSVAGKYEFINSKEAGQYFKFPLVIKKIKNNMYYEIN